MSQSPEEQLWLASTEGNLEMVKELSNNPSVDVNWGDSQYGRTPFYRSCGFGKLEVVEFFLSHPRIDVNKGNAHKVTPLYIACQEGQVAVVRRLLQDERIDVTKTGEQSVPPIVVSSENGHVEIVRLLLEHPMINVNQPNQNACTPFYQACQEGHTEVVRLFLATPGVDVNLVNDQGASPLSIACEGGHVEIVKLLLASTKGVSANIADKENCTPLWIASQNGHLFVVQLLLALVPDINERIKSSPGYDSWNDTSPAQIARLQANAETQEEGETEEEFARVKQNGWLITDLLEAFERDPKAVRTDLVRLPGIREAFIGELFALVVFLSDGFFSLEREPPVTRTSVKKAKAKPEAEVFATRFFKITQRLPMDLQMLLCNRTFRSPVDVVLAKHSERGFRSIVRKIQSL